MRLLHELLTIDNVHDKNITGLRLKEKDLILTIEHENQELNIVFCNIERIRLNEFLGGNIIFDIEVFETDELENMECELYWLFHFDKNNTYDQVNYKKTIEWIQSEKLLLVLISTSYGLHGSILCKDIKVGG